MIKSSNLLIVNGNIFFKRDHDYNFKTRIHKNEYLIIQLYAIDNKKGRLT